MRHSALSPDTQTERLLLTLRQRILHGEFTPGERLTELGLVERLQASRTPIRLALERLAHEGLVDKLSSGGFRLRSFSVSEIWDAIEIRGVLEGTAARFAAERLESDDELDVLRILGSVRRPHDSPAAFAEYLEVNDRFHHELWRLAKSPSLLRSLESATRVPFASPGALIFTGSPEATDFSVIALEHHRGIVDAISKREGSRAEALAREHSRLARGNLLLGLRNKDLMRCLPGASLIETETV